MGKKMKVSHTEWESWVRDDISFHACHLIQFLFLAIQCNSFPTLPAPNKKEKELCVFTEVYLGPARFLSFHF